MPSRGNVIFTLLIVAIMFVVQSAGAFGDFQSPLAEPTGSGGVIAYQGRLADTAGNPLTDTYPMIFRLYSQSSGGVPLWEENWNGPNSVAVSDGLFNVMLGSLTPIPQAVVTGNTNLWLGVTVGTDDEMIPRVQIGSVFYARQALTVPDASITTEKLAEGSVTMSKLAPDISFVPPDGSITTNKLADSSITTAKLANGSVTRAKLAPDTASRIVFLSTPVSLLSRIGGPVDHQLIDVSPYVPTTAKLLIVEVGSGSTEGAKIWLWGNGNYYLSCEGETWHWNNCQGMVPTRTDQKLEWGANTKNGDSGSQAITLLGYVE